MNSENVEAELISTLHDQTMSDDPKLASQARMAKHIFPLFATTLSDEIGRTRDFEIVSNSVITLAATMLSAQIRMMEQMAGPIPPEALEGAIVQLGDTIRSQVLPHENDKEHMSGM